MVAADCWSSTRTLTSWGRISTAASQTPCGTARSTPLSIASGTPWLLATLPMTSMRRWISTFARSAWSSSFSWPFSCSFWALSPVISVWRLRFEAQA